MTSISILEMILSNSNSQFIEEKHVSLSNNRSSLPILAIEHQYHERPS